MPIPTFSNELGQTKLGPNISILRGGGLLEDAGDDSEKLSLEEINKQLKTSSKDEKDTIEFFHEDEPSDLLFEHFMKTKAEAGGAKK